MPILALDTSDAVTVAVTDDDGRVLAARNVTEQRRHAERLAPMIQAVLAETGLGPRDLERVVVGTGPAPFTGLRVGLVTARTFAFAAQIAVDGVSTLDAIAEQAAEELGLDTGTRVLVASDAKRREVYYAAYEVGPNGPERVVGPAVATPANVVADGHATDAVVVGAGAVLYADVFAPVARALPEVSIANTPAALVRVAQRERANGAELGTEPLYLRRPDAQEPGTPKRASR